MSRKGKQKPQQRAEQMNKLIAEWRGSGQSQEQFSISKGLSPKTFGYWLRKQRKAVAESGGFVAVSLSDGRALGAGGGVFVRLRHPEGVEISFEQEVSSGYLRSLLGW
ncbi:MAG: hypothetical protein IPH12_17090 [Saprospirales bacterium]|nr:hypothetical protein [Saprospirales bacterium]